VGKYEPPAAFSPGGGAPGLTRIRVNFEKQNTTGGIRKSTTAKEETFSTTGGVAPTVPEVTESGSGTGIGEGTGSGAWNTPLYKFNPKPRYPREALQRNIEGTVLLQVHVNDRGTAERVEIEKTSGSPLLDKAAEVAVRHWEFIPARRAGIPVASVSRIPIRFQINEEDER